MSKCLIYVTFHFPLKHEKRGISKQSLVLRNAEATPIFNTLPFFIRIPLCHSQAHSQVMSYGFIKSHHVFMNVSVTRGMGTPNRLPHSRYMII